MAGANNAQMKAKGFKKAQIVAIRTKRPGPLTMKAAERAVAPAAKLAPPPMRNPPAGWQMAARGEGGEWRKAVNASRKEYLRKQGKDAGKPDIATLRAKVADMQKRVAAAEAAAPKGKLKLTPGNYTWKRGADGNYSASDGRAKLEKSGKNWTLVMRDGSRHSLGKKASFDKAEQAMARLGAR